MRKIKLKESDLQNIIRKVINERGLIREFKKCNPEALIDTCGLHQKCSPWGQCVPDNQHVAGGGNDRGLGGEPSQAPGMNMSQCTSACNELGGSGEMCTSLCLDGELAVGVEDSLMESYGISETRRLLTESFWCGISCALRISGCRSRKCSCRRCKGKSDIERSLEGWG